MLPYKVIVADPSPSTQKAVQAAFQYPLFEIVPCDNGTDLMETVVRTRPDALLVNLFLPGGDGRSMAQQIRGREEFKNLPIVFLRGAFEAFDVDDEETAGRAVVGKPFDSEKLAVDVRDMIDGATTPPSLPEEPDFDEGNSPADLEQRILALIRQEIPALENRIEKRLSARRKIPDDPAQRRRRD
jgi:DNA-binding response OmpR family regulator